MSNTETELGCTIGNGAIVLDFALNTKSDPDHYLILCLAVQFGDTPYVVWNYNSEVDDAYWGQYHATLLEAVKFFQKEKGSR